MVGRADELRRLSQLARTPGTAVAVLAGEPGIGKTRLVHELVAAAPAGTTVLSGQAEPGSLGRPFELLLSAVDGRTDVDAAQIAVLTDAGRTQVERLQAGLRILRSVTAGGPAIVVFEDLHWADSESIALFERIADLDGDRLLLGTYRPAEVMRRNPIAGLLDRLERRYTVYHVRLERLDLAETSAFIAATTGRAPAYRAAVSLQLRTGGNPFFLEELVRGGGDLDELCEQPLPWSLAETLRRQVEHLPAEHQRLVEAASVLGYRVPFDLLMAVTGRGEAELIAALRELVAEGVLVESGEDEFAFRHALVREAVGERLLGRERRHLHEAALDALLASGDADLALVAKHARGAGRYDDLLAAARRGSASYLAMGSAFQALQLAETGLEEAGDDPDLVATAARAGWLAGLYDDADAHARRWQAVARTPEEATAALRLRVRLAWEVQDFDRMSALSAELTAAADALTPGPAQAGAMAALAQSARLRDLDDEALDWAVRAVAVADERGGMDDIRLAAQVEQGALLVQRAATVEEGRDLLVRVAIEAEKTGEWFSAALALNKLLHLPVSAASGDLADLLERLAAAAERAGSESLTAAAHYQGRARLAMSRGNLAAATEAIERGRARDLNYRRTVSKVDNHGAFLAGLRLEAGDVAGAARIAGELEGIAGMEIGTAALAFHLACRRHDLARARGLVDEVVAVSRATGGRNGEFLHDLTSAALVAPLPVAEVAALVAGLDGPTVADSYRTLVRAQVTEAGGDPAGALAGYAAVAPARSGLPPAARGTAEVGAARCLVTLGRADEARPHALLAQDLLRHWSGWRVEQLDAVRDRLGLRGVDGVAAALTPREREVAQLIAEGLTNADLARRLFISPRTAAVHVSAILRKLGVSSRTEVAGALD